MEEEGAQEVAEVVTQTEDPLLFEERQSKLSSTAAETLHFTHLQQLKGL